MAQPTAEQPAMAPPPGTEPNFTNPQSRAVTVLLINGISTAVLLVFVGMRLYTKSVILKSFDWDDVACILGTMLSIAHAGLVSHIFRIGFGPHQWNVPLHLVKDGTIIKELKTIVFLYDPMTVLAKLSILLLFFRIFATTRRFRIWIYVGIVTTTVNHGTGFVLSLTLCNSSTHIDYARCMHKTRVVNLVVGVCNILNGFFVLLLPLLVISQLQMRYKRKIGLLAVFLTGFGACIVSTMGMIYRILIWHSKDISWTLGPQLVLSVVEVNVTLLAGCTPLIPMIFKHHKIFSWLRGKNPTKKTDRIEMFSKDSGDGNGEGGRKEGEDGDGDGDFDGMYSEMSGKSKDDEDVG